MRRLVVTLAATYLAAPWAQAQINYNYLEATMGVHSVELDDSASEDGVGAGLKASYEVMPFVHVFGSLEYSDFSDLDAHTTVSQLGVGTHYDFSDNRSVFANVGAVTAETEITVAGFGPGTVDDDGYAASLGYRETNHTPMEFRLSLDYVKLNDSDESDSSIDMSLQYALARRFKILGGYQFGGDDDVLRFGVRYYFNRNL